MAALRNVKPGTPVWIPCKDKQLASFSPARVLQIEDGDNVSVKCEDFAVSCEASQTRKVSSADLRLRFDKEDESTCADSTSLVYLNDASILQNLRLRHKADEIYTYTASVLLAVNPYHEVQGLYGDAQCQNYRGRHIGALPPHPYAIADAAYRTLTRERTNQAILISGESGAGKTETAKIVMAFLAFCSGSGSDVAAAIQDRVLKAQPILESLGNAATLRNSNSSRFGKYNKIFFDDDGKLNKAAITTYLLESSRVVVHAAKERTYHVFYELLGGLPNDELAELHLERDRPYKLLHSTGQPVKGFEDIDRKNYTRLREALLTVGLSEDEIKTSFRILAGLIHLGDASVEDENGAILLEPPHSDDEPPFVKINQDSVQKAGELLGIDPQELGAALRRKKIQIRGRNTIHEVARTGAQFRHALHSLIKALYKRLFEQIVERINNSFGGANSEGAHIGILDIYGFEKLQVNSFEQLCINLANERLQQYFVENVLKAEQVLYKREALPWADLAMPDSEPVVGAIGQIFTSLDDFSSRLAKGMGKDATDEKFCERVTDTASKDPARRDILKKIQVAASQRQRNSITPAANEGFTIRHYAGMVEYNTKGWLDKNNDRLLAECEELIMDSDNPSVKALADEAQTNTTAFRSISKKYQQDLESLLQTISTCNLHYIRCFKPNEVKSRGVFDEHLVLDQLVNCGTIELVKIMHDGYPNRCPFKEITERFRGMLPPRFQRYGERTFIEALMMAYEVPQEQWALGMSRLFLKAGQLKKLEDMRSEGSCAVSEEKLQAIVTTIIRKKWVRAIHAVRVCNYVPKMISQLKTDQAASALAKHGLLIEKILPCVQAARQRLLAKKLLARRRIKAVGKIALILTREWSGIKNKRKERVEAAMCLATRIFLRTRRWIAIGRERAVEAADRREAELRRMEDERKRMEAERKRLEEERIKAEEEARIRHEEEERQRAQREIEEAKRREEEELAREEARKLEEKRREEERIEEMKRLEEEAAEQRKRDAEAAKRREEEVLAKQQELEEKEKQIEEERRKLELEREEERRKLDAEKEEEMRKMREELERIKKAELEKMKLDLEQATMKKCASPQRVGSRRSSAAHSGYEYANEDTAVGSNLEDQITPDDSISNLPEPLRNNSENNLQAKQQHQLLVEMNKEQREASRRMSLMQEEIERLKDELARRPSDPATPAKFTGTESEPGPSPLELDMTPGDESPRARARKQSHALQMTPGSGGFQHRMSVGRGDNEPRERRVSMRKYSIAGTSGRRSVATAALQTNVEADERTRSQIQRDWGQEQIGNLMGELYPDAAPGAKHRRSLGLGVCSHIPYGRRRNSQASQASKAEDAQPTPISQSPIYDTGASSAAAGNGEAAVQPNACQMDLDSKFASAILTSGTLASVSTAEPMGSAASGASSNGTSEPVSKLKAPKFHYRPSMTSKN